MTVSIQTLNTGDTGYIGKHNANYEALKSAVEAIQQFLGNNTQGNATAPLGFESAYGTVTSFLGAASYQDSTAGTDLTITSGYAWIASTRAVVHASGSTMLSFSGKSAATYYIKLDGIGIPYIDTVTSSDAIYSVVWTGSAFGTITQLAADQWNAADLAGMLKSAAYALNFTTLDGRLEETEGRVLLKADLGRKAVSTTGGTTALTALADYGKRVIEVSGALTSNSAIELPATAGRDWIVANLTTGAFTVTFKVAGQTGVAVAQTKRATVYANGTDIVRATADV
jgi:hypothetical protein